ncbi:MAG: hypothetical protein JWL96_3887 [Sphingomonas bacterium]|uniref:hypothetical protein n=1 Tax=Sphingomonas bacterium TaxID=1895847 RepID=UPI002615BFF2|nr:hypothetical protein [Sphingomonas bacterium]MDB5711817.1 hypothetical protein [Sphingomonas bacterium]
MSLTMSLDRLAQLDAQARFMLAGQAYERGEVRLVSRDLAGCEHLAATRHGLFAINPAAYRRIAHGLFYGVTILGDMIYVFEAGDRPRHRTNRGRIVRFRRDGDTIYAAEVIATGLDNGCHQIDVMHGELHVLDTYNQQIIVLSLDGAVRRVLHPLPLAADRSGADYVHINSLLRCADDTLLLLHNGGRPDAPRSEVARFDGDWNLVVRTEVDGHGCHNIALLEDGTLLCCGSQAGELIGSNGVKVKLGDMMTRGLSVGVGEILVGGSTFSPRDIRDEKGGTIYFLDRAYRLTSTLAMPAPVMEIRRIDGRDRSLSHHIAGQLPQAK